MRAKAAERRTAHRKAVEGLHIKNLTILDKYQLVARKATLVNASPTGILIRVDRKDLVPKELRTNLTLDVLKGHEMMFQIDEMDLEIDGRITRTKMIGKGIYEIGIDYTEEAPEYWRECLVDLLPGKGDK